MAAAMPAPTCALVTFAEAAEEQPIPPVAPGKTVTGSSLGLTTSSNSGSNNGEKSTCTVSAAGTDTAVCSYQGKGISKTLTNFKKLRRSATGSNWSWTLRGGWLKKRAKQQEQENLARAKNLAEASVDADVLRSVRANRAMSGLGSHFRTSSGSANTYDLSEPTDSIGSFWSHSWHCNAVHKVGTLFFVYNSPIAAICSIIGAALCACLMAQDVMPGSSCYSNGCESHDDCTEGGFCNAVFGGHKRCLHESFCCENPSLSIDGTCPFDCPVEGKPFLFWPLLVGFVVYMLVLVTWQPRTSVFLDKICIHQTDIHKKTQGIDSIGGFLRRSREMLLLWDSTYFSRLWCTFEVAAYLWVHDNDPDGVTVVPVLRGFFVLMAVLVNFFLHFCSSFMWHFDLVYGEYLIDIVGHVMFGCWFVHIARHYARTHYELDRQLRNFSCDNANSWCCTVKHIHPDTGKQVPCDREVIYAVLEQWFVGGKDEFENRVRQDLSSHVHKMMGGMLLFSDALHIGLPGLWRQLSYWGADCVGWTNVGIRVLTILCYWFSLSPFFAGITVWLSSIVRRERADCDWAVSAGLALFIGAFQYGWIILNNICLANAQWAAVLLMVAQLGLGKAMLMRADPRQEDADAADAEAHICGACEVGASTPTSPAESPKKGNSGDSGRNGDSGFLKTDNSSQMMDTIQAVSVSISTIREDTEISI
jgi:hypothetical protein